MFANQFIKNASSKVIAAFAVLVVTGFAFLAVHNSANAQVGAPQADLPSAIEARQELSKIPTDRIARIKDANQRAAFQRVVTSLQAVANNKSQAREAGLINQVDQALSAALNPTQGTHGCFSSVGSDFKSCQGDCKGKGKKFCGCLAAAIVDGVKCLL
ncbi:MAG: hypothetical protein ABI977_33685 [Acidobacteriota bacterium]